MKHVILLLLLLTATTSSAETLLVGNKSAASVSIIDLTTGREIARADTDPGPHEIAVSPNGELAVVTNYGVGNQPGNTLTVIEVEQGRAVGTIDLGEYTRPHGILFLPDNRHVLVTAEGARSLIKVDVWAGKVVSAAPTGQNVSHMLAYDAPGHRAYVANIGSGSVSLINVPQSELLAFQPSGAGAEGIALAPNRRDLWVTNRGEDTVSLFDARFLDLKAKVDVPGFPIRAEVTKDGTVLVTSARSGRLSVIGRNAGEEGLPAVVDTVNISLEHDSGTILGQSFSGSSVPIGIEVGPEGKRVWIAHAAADTVQELEAGSWKQLRLLKTGDEPDAMAYSPLRVAGAVGIRP